MKSSVNVLFIGDIVGQPGLAITSKLLPGIKQKYDIDFTIANGENAAAGKGITDTIALEYFTLGIDVITSGNHIWDNYKVDKIFESNQNLLRPHNYPHGNKGKGIGVFEIKNTNLVIGVLNLQGRAFLYPIDDPFRVGLAEIDKMLQKTKMIVVDFHAESSAEKQAFGWYVDGKVSAVMGTHTHVQTADERILPEGTAYLTDLGMTGSYDSVIGMKKEAAIKRFLLGSPVRYEIAGENLKIAGAVINIDTQSGKATKVERILLPGT